MVLCTYVLLLTGHCIGSLSTLSSTKDSKHIVEVADGLICAPWKSPLLHRDSKHIAHNVEVGGWVVNPEEQQREADQRPPGVDG